MKHAQSLLVCILLAGSLSIQAAQHPPLPDQHRIELLEAFRLAAELGPQIWPGFELGQPPVLLIVGETEYLLNRDKAPDNFAKQEGQRFNSAPIFARPRQMSPAMTAAFPALGDGVDTVVVGTPQQTQRTPAGWTLMVAHELFHTFQGRRGLHQKITSLKIGPPEDSSWHLGFPFPYSEPDIENALHLLGYSIYRAASLPEDAAQNQLKYDSTVAKEAWHNLVRLLELRFGDDRYANYMRYQIAKEGVARYFEHQMAQLAAQGGYRPGAEFASSQEADPYRKIWDEVYSPQLYLIKHAGHVSRSRSEFYGLGHGMALLLDRLSPDWKERYFEPGVWMEDLLPVKLWCKAE